MSLLDAHDENVQREPNFIIEVLRYPFTKSGFPILSMGMVLVIAAEFATIIPVLGLFSQLFIFAYLCGLYFALIDLSASGKEEIYCFPDISDPIEDIAKPALRVLGVFLLSYAPLIALLVFDENDSPEMTPYQIAALVWAAFYFPMAMLATVIFTSIRGALPHVVLPAIFRSGPLYLIAFGLTLALGTIEGFLTPGTIPDTMTMVVLFEIASAFLAMFVLMASARTLGLLYFRREEEIAWF